MIKEDSIEHPLNDTKKVFRVYLYRWIIFINFILAMAPNMIMWNELYPIQKIMQKGFDISYYLGDFSISIVQNVTYLPGTLLANYFFDSLGIAPGIIFATLLTLVGLWSRALSDFSFYFILIGQILGGIAQPFYLNSLQTVSSIWFSERERSYI